MSTLDRFIGFLRQLGKTLMVLLVIGFVGSLLLPALGLAKFEQTTKPVTVLSFFFFFVAFALTERMTRFAASRAQRHSKIREKADALAIQGRYAEAAEVYTRQALEELNTNKLLFAYHCKYAFEMWIKAKEPGKALNEARNVLWVYVDNNGMWLRHGSGDYVENLTVMVTDFFGAGYNSEGAVFAGEANHQLEKFGLPIRCAAVPIRKNIFPTSCIDCGANLSHNPYQDTAQCGYCKAIIYPSNPSTEVRDLKAEAARATNIIAVNAAADAANKSVKAERRIILPPAKQIEKGSPQTFYGNTISYSIPANWERRSTVLLEQYDDFYSPDKKFSIHLSVRATREKEGDMMREFNKIIAEKPEAKVSLKVLSGDTLGILSLSGGDKLNFKMNSICWESFPPPNSQGEDNMLNIAIFFPAEEFEQHKQLISDIYGSFKIRK